MAAPDDSAPVVPDDDRGAGPGGTGGTIAAPSNDDVSAPEYARVFNPDVLHRIAITVDSKHLSQLDNDLDNRVPCTIVWDGVTLGNVGIRKKGFLGSQADLQDEPGFSIKFNEFVPKQRLFGFTKIILNNGQQDASRLNEHIGYELYRRAKLPAALTAHAVVTFNGQPKGFYVVKEAIDERFLERNFGEAHDHGNLYEATDADFGDSDELELKDEQKDMRRRDDIEALQRAINRPASDLWADEVGKLLDLDVFITSYAIDALVVHADGPHMDANNVYLYHHPGTGKFVLIPHGMDALFEEMRNPLERPGAVTSRKIREIPALDGRFRSELRRILTEVWDVDALTTRVNRAVATMHSGTRADGVLAGETEELEGEARNRIDWLKGRKAELLSRLP